MSFFIAAVIRISLYTFALKEKNLNGAIYISKPAYIFNDLLERDFIFVFLTKYGLHRGWHIKSSLKSYSLEEAPSNSNLSTCRGFNLSGDPGAKNSLDIFLVLHEINSWAWDRTLIVYQKVKYMSILEMLEILLSLVSEFKSGLKVHWKFLKFDEMWNFASQTFSYTCWWNWYMFVVEFSYRYKWNVYR